MASHRLVAALALVGLISSCGAPASPPAGSPTPAVVPVVSTPFAAFAASSLARLHEQPGGPPGSALARDLPLMVEGVTTGPDGQLWYRVTASEGGTGWLPATGLSLVADQPAATPTPLVAVAVATPVRPTATAPARPYVVAGSGGGLFLRLEPGQGEVIRSYPDGTQVAPLGEEQRIDGRRWLKVRAPDGREGWMAANYLRLAG